MNLVSNDAAELVELTALTVVDVAGYGKWSGAKVHLTKALVGVSRDTLLADLTAQEADFSGYAAKTITWLVPSVSDDGPTEVVGTVPEFRHNGGATANVVYNAFVTNTAGDKLLAVGAFDSPLPFAGVNDSTVLVVRTNEKITGSVAVVS